MKRLFLLLVLLSLFSSCKQDPWADLAREFCTDPDVGSLIFVKDVSGSTAVVEYYIRVSEGVAASDPEPFEGWTLAGNGSAFIGREGLGKTREGDAKTPVGCFKVVRAFGVLPDPGTSLDYLQVTPSIFACDEEGPWYNKIIDTSAVHHACKGEDMFHTAPEYNYGLELDYNSECVYPNGSAIFLHCKGSKQWTGGCIAIDEEFLKKILVTAKPGVRVCISGD